MQNTTTAPAQERTASIPIAASDAALRARKKREHLMRNLRLIAISYLIDGSVLALFFWVGTISWPPLLIYTSSGLTICAVMALLIGSGWTARFEDPGITIPFTIANQLLQVASMYLFPEVSFMFALILFIVYVTLTMRATPTQSVVAWALVSTLSAVALWLNGQPMRIPSSSLTEQMLAGLFFVITLWRCVWVGSINSGMTALLKNRSQALSALTAQVDHLAHHDELTGLINRRSLLTALLDEQQRADRQHTSLAVALLDIDKFKSVNDTLGHLAGDKTLKLVAGAIKRSTRKTDHFGRYGGEEFLLIMVNGVPDTAHIPIDRMRSAIQTADWATIAPNFSVTFSCGIAFYRPGETIEALVHRADEALYRAKTEGRNCTRTA